VYLINLKTAVNLIPPKVGGLGGLLSQFCVSPE
jgi:hypothetical protein